VTPSREPAVFNAGLALRIDIWLYVYGNAAVVGGDPKSSDRHEPANVPVRHEDHEPRRDAARLVDVDARVVLAHAVGHVTDDCRGGGVIDRCSVQQVGQSAAQPVDRDTLRDAGVLEHLAALLAQAPVVHRVAHEVGEHTALFQPRFVHTRSGNAARCMHEYTDKNGRSPVGAVLNCCG
jgi:hypothetical protein